MNVAAAACDWVMVVWRVGWRGYITSDITFTIATTMIIPITTMVWMLVVDCQCCQ